MHRIHALTRLVLLVSAFLLATTAAAAATLYGKVESVEEGDVLTLINLNRSIKIKLLGIDAPEKDQPLAEVSRLHLADLVLNKFVVVHYSNPIPKGDANWKRLIPSGFNFSVMVPGNAANKGP